MDKSGFALGAGVPATCGDCSVLAAGMLADKIDVERHTEPGGARRYQTARVFFQRRVENLIAPAQSGCSRSRIRALGIELIK